MKHGEFVPFCVPFFSPNTSTNMAKVFTRPDSKFWITDFVVEGQRFKLSTKKLKTEPQEVGERKAKAMEDALILKMAGMMTGERLVQLVNETNHLGRRKGHGPSFRDVSGTFLENKRRDISATTFENYENAFKSFTKSLGRRADVPFVELTEDDVRKWVNGIRDEGAKPYTVQTFAIRIKSVFGTEIKRGRLFKNPFQHVSLPPLPVESNKIPVFREDVEKLVDEAGRVEWSMIFRVAYYTGLRFGDVMMLKPKYFDLVKGEMRFKPSKQKQDKETTLHVPIHDSLKLLLQGWDMSGEYLFPDAAEVHARKRQTGADYSARCFKRAKVAGTFHGIRHGFITRLAKLKVPKEIRQKLVHHVSKDDVHGGYTHYEVEDLVPYINLLEPLGN